MPKSQTIKRLIPIFSVIVFFCCLTAWSFTQAQDATPAPPLSLDAAATVIAVQAQEIVSLREQLQAQRIQKLIDTITLLRDTNGPLAFQLAVELYRSFPSEQTDQILAWASDSVSILTKRLIAGDGGWTIGTRATLSPDQKILVVTQATGQILRWDLATEKLILPILGDMDTGLNGVIFSPKGMHFATDTSSGIHLWNLKTGELQRLFNGKKRLSVLSFTPDGQRLWAIDNNDKAFLWSFTERKVVRTIGLPEPMFLMVNSVDSSLLVATNKSFTKLSILRTSDLSVITEITVDNDLRLGSVGLTPDNKSLVAALFDYNMFGEFRGLITWDISTGQQKSRDIIPPSRYPTTMPSEEIFFHNTTMNFRIIFMSPDAQRLIIYGPTTTTWDLSSGKPVQISESIGPSETVNTVVFGKDITVVNQGHDILLANSGTSSGILHPMSLDERIHYICNNIGRNMSLYEWQQYMGNESYRKTCEQWPLPIDLIYSQAKIAINLAKLQEPEASEKFAEVVDDVMQTTSPSLANYICWGGSIYGFAETVLPICNYGVELMPYAAMLVDSRGLARALTGDIDGAISDFQFFIDAGQNQLDLASLIEQRKNWIQALKDGDNPFTQDVMAALQAEWR